MFFDSNSYVCDQNIRCKTYEFVTTSSHYFSTILSKIYWKSKINYSLKISINSVYIVVNSSISIYSLKNFLLLNFFIIDFNSTKMHPGGLLKKNWLKY